MDYSRKNAKYSRKNVNGVYIDRECITLWREGCNFFEVQIAFTPDGYRGTLNFWYKTRGSMSPIMDMDVPYNSKKQCIYNTIREEYKRYNNDYYIKNEPKMIEILRRLMEQYKCEQLELF